MSCANDASFNFGDAISAGLGVGMGLVLVPYMLQKPHFNKVPKIVIVCLNCQSKNPQDFKFCGHCGQALYPSKQLRCLKCNTIVPDTKFCGNCGTELKK